MNKKSKIIGICLLLTFTLIILLSQIAPLILGAYYTDSAGVRWYYNTSALDNSVSQLYVQGCSSSKTTLTIPSTINGYTVKAIGGDLSYNITRNIGNLSNITSISIPNTVTTIGKNTFKDMSFINSLDFLPSSVTWIGNLSFAGTSLPERIDIPANIKVIDTNAFKDTSVTQLNVYGNTNVYAQGSQIKDIFLMNEIAYASASDSSTVIHPYGDTHTISSALPEGVKLIDENTGDEIVDGTYDCQRNLKLKCQIESGYTYDTLYGKITTNDGTTQYFNLSEGCDYQLVRDIQIDVFEVKNSSDLVLRQYISSVNNEYFTGNRDPKVVLENGNINYQHSKKLVYTEKGDSVVLNIRVYNEGSQSGTAREITEYITDGLVFDPSSEINTQYGWVVSGDGKSATTTYLSNKTVAGNLPNSMYNYEEIQLALKVDAEAQQDSEIRMVMAGEITNGDTTISATHGNLQIDNTYKNEEARNSNDSSYIIGTEKDDDFENVIVKYETKIEYSLKITKTDVDTGYLLEGAKFELLDESMNTLATAITDENGVLDFGTFSRYGSGIDVYFIKEVSSPSEYKIVSKLVIQLTAESTVLDRATGEYAVNVKGDILDYEFDMSNLEYVPVYTRAQLSKIGSGETVLVDGKEYEYTEKTNYMLMNDIDLGGEDWEPIPYEVKGVINGNGHKISNLTIKPSAMMDYTEIGLFKVFSGTVYDLDLVDVDINIPPMNVGAESITGYEGVGAFAGVAKEVMFIDSSVSGNITSNHDNVGGFVGHSTPKGIIRTKNCQNHATVTSTGYTEAGSNVGGIVGCALGAVSMEDTTNDGSIVGYEFNVGGLVGYIEATEYTSSEVRGNFDAETNEITIDVTNKKVPASNYNIILENIDEDTKELIRGGRYTILDRNKEVLLGCSNVELVDGKSDVASINIKNLGTDIYYVVEDKPGEGYQSLDDYLKVKVRRIWNSETNNYEVIVDTDEEAMSEDEVTGDVDLDPEVSYSSNTGKTKANETYSNFTWDLNKLVLDNCTNNGVVYIAGWNAGGLVGKAYCGALVTNCTNNANVTAVRYGRAGGIIGDIRRKTEEDMLIVSNCTNNQSAVITSGGGTYDIASAGGIVGLAYMDAAVTECKNHGVVTYAGGQQQFGGIIGDYNGKLNISNCKNTGTIGYDGYSSSITDFISGGIIGHNHANTPGGFGYDGNEINITDCTNTGIVYSPCHLGGILGKSNAPKVTIKRCQVNNGENSGKLIIKGYQSDIGGIAGLLLSEEIDIEECVVTDCAVNTNVPGTYGAMSGIVGCIYATGRDSWGTCCGLNKISIKDCTVKDCTFKTLSHDVAGVIGHIQGTNASDVEISGVSVYNCQILCENAHTGTYDHAGGLIAGGMNLGNISISDSIVQKSTISVTGTGRGDTNVGGILGHTSWNYEGIDLKDCQVNECNIELNISAKDDCANCSGMIGEVYQGSDSSKINVTNCELNNTNVATTQGNMGGIVARSDRGVTVKDSTVTRSNLESTATNGTCSVTAGIVGSTNGDLIIDNCNVIGDEFNGDVLSDFLDEDDHNGVIYGRGDNVEGLASFALGNATITNSHVKNIRIQSENGAYSNINTDINIVAGLFGSANKNLNMDTCSVQNTIVDGYTAHSSGAIGCGSTNGGTNNLRNITVDNSKITNKIEIVKSATNTGTAGIIDGVPANSVIEKCYLKNSIVRGTGASTGGITGGIGSNNVTISDCHVENSTIERNVQEEYRGAEVNNTSIGGITAASSASLNIINCSVKGSIIKGNATTMGGISAYCYDKYNANKKATIKDCLIEDTDMEFITYKTYLLSQFYHKFGGVIGGEMATIENTTLKNVEMKNTRVLEEGETRTNPIHVGGIVGFGNEDNKLTVKNSNVDNLEMKFYTNTEHIGGIIGYQGNAENCTVKDLKITSPGLIGGIGAIFVNATDCTVDGAELINTESGNTAGIVASGGQNFNNGLEEVMEVTGCTVNDLNITGSGVIGGVGAVYVNAENCTVDGAKLVNNSSNNVTGGIIASGYGRDFATVTGCTAKNIEITSPAIAGGIGGSGVDVSDSDVDTITINMIGESGYNHSAGVVGYGNVNDVTAKNVTITDENMEVINSNTRNAAGVVAITESNMSNIEAENVNINLTKSGIDQVGGVVGLCRGQNITNASVDNVVINCDISIGRGSIRSVAGIAGVTLGNVTNSTVTSPKINLYGDRLSNTGGIAGVASNIDECNVIGTKGEDYIRVNSPNTSMASSGGAGGIAGICNSSVNNSSVSGVNIEVKCQYVNMGGISGIAHSNTTNNTIVDCTLSGTGCLGGIIGITEGNLTDSVATRVTIENTGNAQNTGGIVAIGSLVDNDSINSCTITSARNVGGIAGIASTITNCTATGSTVTNTTSLDNTGGIAGVGFNSLQGNNVISCNVYGGEKLGGIIGVTDGTITDCAISNSSVSGVGYVGGIAAVSPSNISGCNVSGATISTTGSGRFAGGIVGVNDGPVSNCTVTGSSISDVDGHLGGIAGVMSSGTTCTITGCSVSGTDIYQTRTASLSNNNGLYGYVGGIAGVVSAAIENSNVSGSTISNVDSYIGGIVGHSTSTLNNCNLTESTVSSSSTNAYGLGGIVGHGANFKGIDTVITGCTVTSSTLEGANAVGGIAGAAVSTITGCTVTGGNSDPKESLQQTSNSEPTAQPSSTPTTNASPLMTMVKPLQVNNTTQEGTDKDNTEETTEDTNETQETEENSETNDNQEKVTNEENLAEQTEIDSTNVEEEVTGSEPETTTSTVKNASEVNEEEYGTIIKGINYVGGILGFAGEVDDTYSATAINGYVLLNITGCDIIDSLVEGASNVGESVGKKMFYKSTGEEIEYTAIVVAFDLLTSVIAMIQ